MPDVFGPSFGLYLGPEVFVLTSVIQCVDIYEDCLLIFSPLNSDCHCPAIYQLIHSQFFGGYQGFINYKGYSSGCSWGGWALRHDYCQLPPKALLNVVEEVLI